MNKIYIVKELWVFDDESGNTIYAFSSLDKAKQCFKDMVENAKSNQDYDTIEEDEMYFSYYDDGYYMTGHTNIMIDEMILDSYNTED